MRIKRLKQYLSCANHMQRVRPFGSVKDRAAGILTRAFILIAILLLTACVHAIPGPGAADGNPLIHPTTAPGKEGTGDAEQTAEDNDPKAADSVTDADAPKFTRDFYAMDTFISLTVYGDRGKEVLDLCQDEMARLENLLSTEIPSSDIARLNEAGEGVLSGDAWALLEKALYYGHETGGAFDIAVYPVMQAWGFPSKEYRVPDSDELAELLELSDIDAIETAEDTHTVRFLKEGMAVDLGGIAKGFASARLMDLMQDEGIRHGLADLGGNIQTLGLKPDGSEWKVGVTDPTGRTSMLGILSLHDRAVITSGGYERYFEEDGIRYHHIIDPATGYPAESGLMQSTVISADGTMADILSTSLFIMGEVRAADYWRAHKDEFDMILYTDEDEILVTPGAAACFDTKRPYTLIEE